MHAPTRNGIDVPKWKCQSNHLNERAPIMKITTIGIDLAKTVFAVHRVNEHGRAVLKKILKRDQVAAFFANLSPCLIQMEACGARTTGLATSRPWDTPSG
jgi:transposase